MKATAKPKTAKAKKMTDDEWRALVTSMCGKYAWVGGSSDDVIRDRREEVAREEAKFAMRYLKRSTNGKK
ncbi:MAG: hypothetical protein Q8922_05185 [Bacteroidota bacterium]|nr:hypothetical protein [Bacteroidota bacterium]